MNENGLDYNTVLYTDALTGLGMLKDAGVKVQMCVTSPPYWGLRDYGVTGQLGLEPTPQEYVSNMVEVFRGVRDVLADDGTLWCNIGDSYAGSGVREDHHANPGLSKACERDHPQHRPGTKRADGIVDNNSPRNRNGYGPVKGLKPKDLVGIPWMLAFALRDDGWWLRCDIIWHKPSCMPESVTDRPTRSHEYLFLLAKNKKYYYDHEAVKEHSAYPCDDRKARSFDHHKHTEKANYMAAGKPAYPLRNKRSVWSVSNIGYSQAHFATFPPNLIKPCILASSRPGDIVLDPFLGSGTTAQVAESLGRNWIGIELNEAYRPLIEKRLGEGLPEFLEKPNDEQPALFTSL